MSVLAIVLIAIGAANVLLVWLLAVPPKPRQRRRRWSSALPTAGPDQPTMPLPRPDFLPRR